MADVLPSPVSLLIVTLLALVGLNVLKFLAAKYPFFELGGLVPNITA